MNELLFFFLHIVLSKPRKPFQSREELKQYLQKVIVFSEISIN